MFTSEQQRSTNQEVTMIQITTISGSTYDVDTTFEGALALIAVTRHAGDLSALDSSVWPDGHTFLFNAVIHGPQGGFVFVGGADVGSVATSQVVDAKEVV